MRTAEGEPTDAPTRATGDARSIGLVACGSTGDTAALMAEGAAACSAVCDGHPGIDAFSYEAGGGSPLLFSGRIGTSCVCSRAEGDPRAIGEPGEPAVPVDGASDG